MGFRFVSAKIVITQTRTKGNKTIELDIESEKFSVINVVM